MGESGNILIPMIAVGVALGGLILTSSRGATTGIDADRGAAASGHEPPA